MLKHSFGLLVLVMLVGVFAGCGVDRVVSSPTVELVEALAPDALTNTPAPPAATLVPLLEASVCQTLQNLNLRIGPGLSYAPPLRVLPSGTALTPLAFSAVGFPDGQWIQVRDDAVGDEGWVSAAAQFVRCNVAVATLPQADNIPPTPTPLPTSTPEATPTTDAVAGGPPRVTNNAPGGTAAEYVEDEVIVDDDFLFRMYVLDTRFGHTDGDGIAHVDFIVTTLGGDVVYSRRENHAAYCVFSGGDPHCDTWPQRDGRFVWGSDGPEVWPGNYHVSILVTPKDPAFEGEVWNWDFDFTVELP